MVTLKEKFLQVFFCYFDEYEFYFVFFVPSKKQNYDFIKTIAFKNTIEFYIEKIKEMFNEFVNKNIFAKLSKVFEMNVDKTNILKLTAFRVPESSKFCYLQIENFIELPSDLILKRKYFLILFDHILKMLHNDHTCENFDINLISGEKIEKDQDLSYLCSLIPDNKPQIFIEKESNQKKSKKDSKNKRNTEIYKEILVTPSTIIECEFSEKNNKLFLIFSEKVKK